MKLNWTKSNRYYGARFSKGKCGYYAITIRGVPENLPRDYVLELYLTDRKMTAFEIKTGVDRGNIRPISRMIVQGSLNSLEKIEKSIENMKRAARRKESKMDFNWISF